MLAPLFPVTVSDVNVAEAGVGIFSTFATNVEAPLPVVVRDVIRLVYAVFQFVSSVVVGMTYPLVNVIAIVPLVVIGTPLTDNPVGTEAEMLVTVPPVPVAVNVVPVKLSPLPIVNSCTAVVVLELPNILLVVLTDCILA